MPRRQAKQRRRGHRRRAWLHQSLHRCAAPLQAAWAATSRRLEYARRATHPRVTVLGDAASRRTARLVGRAGRAYAHAFGVALPDHTTVLLTPVVYDTGRVQGLLQVVAPPGAAPRTVLTLATGPHDQPADIGELLAVLRLLVARLAEEHAVTTRLQVRVQLTSDRVAAAPAPARIIPWPADPGGRHVNGAAPPAGRDQRHFPTQQWWTDHDPA